MFRALYTQLPNAGRNVCPARQAQALRWLVCRTTLDRPGNGGAQTSISASECMPR